MRRVLLSKAPLLLARFVRQKDGSVVILFAVGLAAALTLTGVGVEYSRIGSAREKLQNAVDNAALATKRRQIDRMKGGEAVAHAEAVVYGRETFDANFKHLKSWFVLGAVVD